jgi:alanine racemase
MPILVIGYTPLENILENRLDDVAFCVVGLESLQEVAHSLKAKTKIHLEIDTGMHRHGIMPEEIGAAAALVRSNPHIALEGVYSHLADADTPGSAHVELQVRRWNEAVKEVRKHFPHIKYIHCAATAGSAHLAKMEGNVMRLGLGLYGVNAASMKLDLHPALEMRTRITSLRTVGPGESVGYNATFTASKEMRIASIPAGYTEGMDRRLSNKGIALVREKPCSIVGRVSMNISSIDVSAIPDVKVGEKATVISKDPGAPNSVEKIAAVCGTIPYEILVHIPAHLRRVIV